MVSLEFHLLADPTFSPLPETPRQAVLLAKIELATGDPFLDA